MSLTIYCSTDEIRSALGVSDVELADEILLTPLHEAGLKMELVRAAPKARAAFLLAVVAPAPTEAQTMLVEALRVFATYAVARRAGASLGMLAPKDLHDDKSGFSRFSDGPYKDTLARLENLYAVSRTYLQESYANLAGSTAPATTLATVFLASSRTYDPVAGA